jgi:hypothetical protein
MASTQTGFVKAKDAPSNKKAQQVATMMESLLKASPDPVPFNDLCNDAGVKYPQDIQAGMIALELSGAVTRYTYTEAGSQARQIAYAHNTKESANRPT